MRGEIDEIIHQKNRLMIMAHLAALGESDFLDLKRALGLTDGNLSIHTGVLETNGYVESEKSFVGRKTRTTYRITPKGRKAFEEYVLSLEQILKGKPVDPEAGGNNGT